MNVTVFGASGKVGRLVVERLLHEGHTVTVFVHYASPFTPSEQLKIVTSDVHNAAVVETAVRGADAVICTLGSWHTPTKDILSAAMSAIIPAMQQARVPRIITLTGSAANAPTDQQTWYSKTSHRLFGVVAKDIMRDAETHLQLLAASELDWTVIRSPVMRNHRQDQYVLNDHRPGLFATVSRTAVAHAIVAQLGDEQFVGQAPHIHQA